MKVLDQVKKRVQKYINKKRTRVIVIPRLDPWVGDQRVHVLAKNPYKKFNG